MSFSVCPLSSFCSYPSTSPPCLVLSSPSRPRPFCLVCLIPAPFHPAGVAEAHRVRQHLQAGGRPRHHGTAAVQRMGDRDAGPGKGVECVSSPVWIRVLRWREVWGRACRWGWRGSLMELPSSSTQPSRNSMRFRIANTLMVTASCPVASRLHTPPLPAGQGAGQGAGPGQPAIQLGRLLLLLR